MQHPDSLLDDLKPLLWDTKPNIEGIYHLSSDLFAGYPDYIGVRFEYRLFAPWVSVDIRILKHLQLH